MSISIFDIIGPRMIGPSSSHTAGAVRIGQVANRLVNGRVQAARVTLYGSFAETGRGHGTDTAIVAGILGVNPDQGTIRYAKLLAKEADVDIPVLFSDEEPLHPAETEDGRHVPGSISFVPSSAGLMIAGEIIRTLALKEE